MNICSLNYITRQDESQEKIEKALENLVMKFINSEGKSEMPIEMNR